MKKAFCILMPLILWAPLLFAQVKFTATASKINVSIGEQFKIDFTVNDNADHFHQPDFSAFQLLTGPELVTNHNFNNGIASLDITYSYVLVAKNEGTFNINAASIAVNGEQLLSNPLTINVKGQFKADQQQQNFAVEDSSKAAQVDIKTLPKQIFLKAEADRTMVDVGEQVTVTYKLYTRVDILRSELDKTPDLIGFSKQIVANPNRSNNPWTTENVNGIKYRVIIAKQLILMPEYAGDLAIPAVTMATNLQFTEKGDPDNPSGNYRQMQYELKSAPIIIHAVAVKSK